MEFIQQWCYMVSLFLHDANDEKSEGIFNSDRNVDQCELIFTHAVKQVFVWIGQYSVFEGQICCSDSCIIGDGNFYIKNSIVHFVAVAELLCNSIFDNFQFSCF